MQWKKGKIELDIGSITASDFIIVAEGFGLGLNTSINFDFTDFDNDTAQITIGGSNFDPKDTDATFDALEGDSTLVLNTSGSLTKEVIVYEFNNAAINTPEAHYSDGTLGKRVANNTGAGQKSSAGFVTTHFPYVFMLFRIENADAVSTGTLKISIAQYKDGE